MHAYLIIGDDKAVDEKIKGLTSSDNSKIMEFPLNKIQDVRELDRFTSRSREKTIFISRHIDKASIESLNAFLKNLEEPNPNIKYILTASNIGNILPTITSRCVVIELKKDTATIKNEELVKKFLKGKLGKKFTILDSIKKKEEAIMFLNDLTIYLHQKLINTKDEHLKYSQFIKAVEYTNNAINMNGNVSLQLTKLVTDLNIIETKYS